MKILAIIPARMASSRFPGKPMMPILGKPMIGHVYEKVSKSLFLNKVAVATCDQEIKEYIESIGGQAIITSDKHERASDRCAEALLKIEITDNVKYDIVVMVQGDEPMIHSDMIDEAVAPMLKNSEINVVNLMGQILKEEDMQDRNCIKVVFDSKKDALYFSREPIPTRINHPDFKMYKQVCVIPFKRDFLIEYTNLSPTPLELAESVDMMRILEHGFKVRMEETFYETQAVDTQDDLVKVEKAMRKNL
jgi:3-deoxy-manno-octulosonate cytidylyltransferase (CMP-KDO synthetase)